MGKFPRFKVPNLIIRKEFQLNENQFANCTTRVFLPSLKLLTLSCYFKNLNISRKPFV